MNVLPDLTARNLANEFMAHAELGGNGGKFLPSGAKGADLPDLALGELRSRAGLSPWPPLWIKARRVRVATREAFRVQPCAVCVTSRHPLLPHRILDILGGRAKKQVVRIHAQRYVACMADGKPAVEWPGEHFVGHAVRPAESSNPYPAVSILVASPYPKPASLGDANLRHESSEAFQVGTGKRDGRIEVSHGEPPQQVPVVRLGLSVSALGRAALHCTPLSAQLSLKGAN